MHVVEMRLLPVTHSSTAKQEEKLKERGSSQTLAATAKEEL